MSCSQDDPSRTRPDADDAGAHSAMAKIASKILVLSGKGGVGKSTVAANLAFGLAGAGQRVGLFDADVHGPSVPRLTGLTGQRVGAEGEGLRPLQAGPNLKVMSVAFLLEGDDTAVIWRGPMKFSAIKQLLTETDWGELDYLVIDAPPGTGDEPLSIAQLVGAGARAVVVTTPQKVAVGDVRRCITFCRKLSMPIAGIVENMAGLTCPHCGERLEPFGRGGGRQLAHETHLPLLASIPLDPEVALSGDDGKAIGRTAAGQATRRAFGQILDAILQYEASNTQENTDMERIAIPVADGRLCMHFGHCEQFAVVDVDPEGGQIRRTELLTPPPHEPGVLPRWLAEQGVTTVLAGGMGQRARQLFAGQGIEVRVGAPPEPPEQLVAQYVAGNLPAGENVCDH